MAVCASCGNTNASHVRFCVYCGEAIAAIRPVAPPPPVGAYEAGAESRPADSGPASRPVGLVTFSSSTDSPPTSVMESRPVFRPLGLVYVMVASFFFAPLRFSLFSSSYVPAITSGNASWPANPILLQLITFALIVGGLLEVTGGIGMWIQANWSRRLLAYVQAMGILTGLLFLLGTGKFTDKSYPVLMGLALIAHSVALIVYLLRPEMDGWFRDR